MYARLIAFYLPQFHPIPENDRWWGKGFTEWTNVARAKPLFRGHYQPHIPADLGFYDLRVPETRLAQAELARAYGIEGFCYWHYWFAGKRLLERPFNEVLKSGQPDFPFCLAWANASWTGVWYGAPEKILIEQTYPGPQDDEAHFYTLLEAFADDRYIRVEGKPLLMIFYPEGLPDPLRTTTLWRELAVKAGLKGLYIVGSDWSEWWPPEKFGLDALVLHLMQPVFYEYGHLRSRRGLPGRLRFCLKHGTWKQLYHGVLTRPTVYRYADAVRRGNRSMSSTFVHYPAVTCAWDNTPRSGRNGLVLHNSTPALYARHLRHAINLVADREPDKRIVFLRSWNEWAEGNYLEPDLRFGTGYLEATRQVLAGSAE